MAARDANPGRSSGRLQRWRGDPLASQAAEPHTERGRRPDEHHAFGALYKAHFNEIVGLLTVRTRDRCRAEELASETFLRAFRQIRTLTYRGSSVRAWLMTIAKNLAWDDLKSARRRHEVLGSIPDDRAGDEAGPELIACARVAAAQVARAMTSLTKDQHACVKLRFLDELTVAETAEQMRRTPEAIRALQMRALRRMADALDAQVE